MAEGVVVADRDELRVLAERGDADAALALGEMLIRGMHGPRDVAAGVDFVRLSAERGNAEARRCLAYFVAKGIAAESDFERGRAMLAELAPGDPVAALQLDFLPRMTCLERVATAERTTVREEPTILVVHALFSPAECRYLMHVGERFLVPAMVGSRERRRDSYRDSDDAAISPMIEDLVVQRINQAIGAVAGLDPRFGEPLTVLRYRAGQQYKPHHDALRPADPRDERVKTGLIYLNGEYEGGGTRFLAPGITIRGAVGDYLQFDNVDRSGTPYKETVHAGLPVERGEKWIASRWLRGRDFLEDEAFDFTNG